MYFLLCKTEIYRIHLTTGASALHQFPSLAEHTEISEFRPESLRGRLGSGALTLPHASIELGPRRDSLENLYRMAPEGLGGWPDSSSQKIRPESKSSLANSVDSSDPEQSRGGAGERERGRALSWKANLKLFNAPVRVPLHRSQRI